MRRKGLSLEFKDFVPYTFGDDVRHVDWRASARYGSADDLLVRQFAAEEQMTLAVSIDTRATMRLPEAMPKLGIALWLAEAVSSIALGSEDRIVLHRLFGRSGDGVVERKGQKNRAGLRSFINRMADGKEPDDDANLKALQPHLPPASVWIIATDLYFDPEMADPLARGIAAALDGLRWIILVDLDSWPHEKAILGEGARRIEGPGLDAPDPRYEIADESIRNIEEKIESHKRDFLRRARRGAFDRVHWRWPSVKRPDPAEFFKAAFFEDKILRRLFMRGG